MARNTIADVREIVESIDNDIQINLTFNCWGVGENKYELMNEETGETYGPVCVGTTEFIKLLRGFEARGRVE
jgi:hypothetical protein